MQKNKIVSNINYLCFDYFFNKSDFTTEYISPALNSLGEPRKIMKQMLLELQAEHGNDCPIILGMRAVGRRIIHSDMSAHDIAKLINGRRHRIYFGLRHGKRQAIVFAWYKIKNLTSHEIEFVVKNWDEHFFEKPTQNGKFLVKQVGGCSLENLIYRFFPTRYLDITFIKVQHK